MCAKAMKPMGGEPSGTNATTATEAIRLIRSGQRVFIGSSCGEPQTLVNELLLQKDRFSDLEIIRLLSLEGSITSLFGDQTYGHTFTVRSIYQGAGAAKGLAGNRRFLTPMNISVIPKLFRTRQLPIHAALVQVSPPDALGWMSLGISVDVTLAAAKSADRVIAQVNPRMPRVLGNCFLHVSEVDAFVEREEELLTILDFPEPEASAAIARLVANLIEDGATIQVGLGDCGASILQALAEKNDLGVHTQYMTDGLMQLVRQGVVTNRYKTLHEGKLIASNAIGSTELYDFLDDNASVEFHPSDYVNAPAVIAQNRKMVAINIATAIDLTGQVAAEALPQNQYSGVTGMFEFIEGANYASEGKSIIVLPSTQADGASRIVARLDSGAVVIPRSHVSHVVSEYGAVNLFGKNLQERALAMISLAHPSHRDDLLARAKEMGLVSRERTVSEALFGIYPAGLEEILEYQGVRVIFRPAKVSDYRRIQEHYYDMDTKDVASRFFQQRITFFQDDMENLYQIDYIKDLTLVAVAGVDDFGRIVGVGEYKWEPSTNMAEVAFSVSREWQGKGIACTILRKLAEAARENGMKGLVAYTSPRNFSMIKLFKRLPYRIETSVDEFLILRCTFDETAG